MRPIVPVLLILTTLFAGCHHPPDPFTVECNWCDQEGEDRVEWSVRYMRAAARSGLFVSLLDQAVSKGIYLQTDQEFLFAGPYVPCNAPDDTDYRDPEFFQEEPDLASLAVLIIALTHAPLKITDYAQGGVTAEIEQEYEYGHTNEIVIHPSQKVFTQDPDHQQGWVDHRFGDIHPSYAVDELAGIILHEMLHSHGFEHGNENGNQCGYDSWECSPSGNTHATPTCRKNSLNEIAEAVMSEVVQMSTGWCKDPSGAPLWQPPAGDPGYVPIDTVGANSPNTAVCENESYL